MLKFFNRSRLPLLLLTLLLLTGCTDNITQAASVTNIFSSGITSVFAGIISIVAVVGLVAATFLGKLMSSHYVLGGEIGDTLNLTWGIIRNFVNIGFMVVLLILAIRVILGFGEDSGTGVLKKILPKFIIGIIAVNLTFFGARLLLTTSDVLATAVFTLPRAAAGQHEINSMPCDSVHWSNAEACNRDITTNVGRLFESQQSGQDNRNQVLSEIFNNIDSEMPMSMVQSRGVPLALLVNLVDFKKLLFTQQVFGGIGSWIISLVFSLVAAGAVTIAYIMLFVAFVIRMVMLWIMIVLSPAAVLVYVLKDVVPGVGEAANLDVVKKFVNYAFMPVYAAVPLSIGMVMILIGSRVVENGNVMDLESLFGGNLNAILWWIASIAIIWVGTQKAIETGGELAGKATGYIHSAVGTAVKGGASILKYAPIVPASLVGGDKDASVATLLAQPRIFKEGVVEGYGGQQAPYDFAKSHGYGPTDEGRAFNEMGREAARSDGNQASRQRVFLSQASATVLAEEGSRGNQARERFLRSAGLTPGQIGNVGQLNQAKFAKLLTRPDYDATVRRTYGKSGSEIISQLGSLRSTGAETGAAGATGAQGQAFNVNAEAATGGGRRYTATPAPADRYADGVRILSEDMNCDD